jgi:hypothetical protein
MKRYDLRELKKDFLPRMVELMNDDIKDGENGIFLFEIGDFSAIQITADMVKENRIITGGIPLRAGFKRKTDTLRIRKNK